MNLARVDSIRLGSFLSTPLHHSLGKHLTFTIQITNICQRGLRLAGQRLPEQNRTEGGTFFQNGSLVCMFGVPINGGTKYIVALQGILRRWSRKSMTGGHHSFIFLVVELYARVKGLVDWRGEGGGGN